ncbi:MAG: DUF167 domain-containing protein [Blastocatellia bacterium]
MVKLAVSDNSITFAVRVQPRASRSEIVGEFGDAFKIRLAAPPVDGEANEELIRFLAKFFGVARAQISIRSGQTSKNKLIAVTGISADEAESAVKSALGD